MGATGGTKLFVSVQVFDHEFADRFERELVHQGSTFRSLDETLATGWRLLAAFPRESLTRVKAALLDRHLPRGGEAHGAGADHAHGAAGRAGAAADGPQGGAAAPGQT
jgi:hypothetical protein